MTKEQLKIIFSAILFIMVIALLLKFREWVSDHILILMLPILVIGTYIERKYRNKPDKQIKLNIFIAIYIALYAAASVIGAIYIAINNIELHYEFDFVDLITALLLLFLPMLVIEIKEAYINAGKKN